MFFIFLFVLLQLYTFHLVDNTVLNFGEEWDIVNANV
jgi:hypothetical protein